MTAMPEELTENPNTRQFGMHAPDFLSHVLSQIRLGGDRIYIEDLADGMVLDLQPDAPAVCVVNEGALEMAGAPPRTIEQADLILVSRGAEDLDGPLRANGPTRVVVCEFHFDAGTLEGLVSALPAFIHIPREEGGAWLRNLTFYMLAESGAPEPGVSLMIARLIDVIVIRTLRSWAQREAAQGWLRGLADPRIARVIQAIHADPFRAWTIAELVELAGMSRSSLASRFAEMVGVPPLRYHNQWRLMLARDQLRSGRYRVGDIALKIGYESEAAFSRAYKSEFGHAPRMDLPRLHQRTEK